MLYKAIKAYINAHKKANPDHIDFMTKLKLLKFACCGIGGLKQIRSDCKNQNCSTFYVYLNSYTNF